MNLHKLSPLYIFEHRKGIMPVIRQALRRTIRPFKNMRDAIGVGRLQASHPLLKVQVETCSWCNLKCRFCPNSHIDRPHEFMDRALFDKIVSELAAINFTGMFIPYLTNEPFLDPRMLDLLRHARTMLPGAYIMLDTNCTVLDKEKLTAAIAAGIDDIRLNCYSREMYDRMNAMAAELPDRAPVHYIVPYFEEQERTGFYNRAGNLDASPTAAESLLPAHQTCMRPFTQMFINYKGQAVLCCSDWHYEVVMGDAGKEKIVDIWENDRYQHYRKQLRKGRRDNLDLCRNCDYKDEGLSNDLVPSRWKRRRVIRAME